MSQAETNSRFSPEKWKGSERKRERDKLNQRHKRQRQRDHVASLEARIRYLELEIQNAKSQQCTCSAGVLAPPSYLSDSEIRTPNWRADYTAPQPLWRPSSSVANTNFLPTAHADFDNATPECHVATSSKSSCLTITTSLDAYSRLLATPEWLRLPLLTYSPLPASQLFLQTEQFGPVVERLRMTPNIAALLPAKPKVLDLLLGGSRNELVELILSTLDPYPLLPPERFAASWLLYLYFRWYIAPSQESFLAIPKHMRPTPCQLLIKHPFFIVAVLWPSLRDKLVLHWSKHNLQNVVALLTCTIRVRGAFNGKFIVRKNEGEPQVDAAFYQQFIDNDGWGILEGFWIEYPDLVEGVDRNIMIREEHLLPS